MAGTCSSVFLTETRVKAGLRARGHVQKKTNLYSFRFMFPQLEGG